MKRRARTGGKKNKERRRKTPTAKRRAAPATARPRRPSYVDLQEQLGHSRRELREAREQQIATSEVLKVISSSPGDLQRVFEVMLENATRICEARSGNLLRYEDGAFAVVALHNAPAAFVDDRRRNPLIRPTAEQPLGRLVSTKQTVHVADLKAEPSYIGGNVATVGLVELAGARTLLSVPLLKDNEVIGAFNIYRQDVRPFTDKQIELVQNFAAQAVIAIENTRLLNELRQRTDDLTELLEQQTATSEVLKAISSLPGTLEPVFQAMLANAVRLCEAKFGVLWLCEENCFRAGALHNVPSEFAEFWGAGHVRRPPKARLVVSSKQCKRFKSPISKRKQDTPGATHSWSRGSSWPASVPLSSCPCSRKDDLIGAIGIYQQEVRPFTGKQVDLVSNFAAQAVIAIENTRLLNELRQRTDDLTESLEQQTATSEVLKVISSSPSELQPVFQAMLENAVRICGAKFGNMFRYENGEFYPVARLNLPPALANSSASAAAARPIPAPFSNRCGNPSRFFTRSMIRPRRRRARRPSSAGRARTSPCQCSRMMNWLAQLPSIARRSGRSPTSRSSWCKNFAAQAVIAIENTRLLSELRQRTDDLTESLEQQTATSEVLQVISSSPGELEPVFNAILANARRICEAKFAHLMLYDGELFHPSAMEGAPPAFVTEFWRGPQALSAATGPGRAVATKQVVHIPDMQETEAYKKRDPQFVAMTELTGARAVLVVPMLKDDRVIGTFSTYRQEARPFTGKQIELGRNFAAQAVIAIENTRLLGELRESLQQQTATADVLKVISRSAFDLQTVLDTLAESACRLCRAERTAIRIAKDGLFHNVADYGFEPSHRERMRNEPVKPDEGSMAGRVVLRGAPVHLIDAQADPNVGLARRSQVGRRALDAGRAIDARRCPYRRAAAAKVRCAAVHR